MIIIKRSIRRRLSLLAGGSLSVLWLLAGASVGSVGLLPSVAHAANECGDPNANGSGFDFFFCSGTFSSITYPSTNGDMLILTESGLVATTGGFHVNSPAGNYVGVYSDSADPIFTNTAGAGFEIMNSGGTNDVGLVPTFTGGQSLSITGTTSGVRMHTSGSGVTWFWSSNNPNDDSERQNGSITATAGAGIEIGTSGTGFIDIQNVSAVKGTTAAVWITDGATLRLANGKNGFLDGRLIFENTDQVNFTNRGGWRSAGASFLGDGDTAVVTYYTGKIQTNVDAAATSIDFGDGTNTFRNDGVIAVGVGQEGAATLTITHLPVWNNGGSIYFGSNFDGTFSDGAANDRIVVATPTTFTGSGEDSTTHALGSELFMDVAFTGAGQGDCSAAVTADCFDLRGSTVAGTTSIVVNSLGGPGSLKPIVLVDVNGGTSAAGNFTLSNESVGWVPTTQGQPGIIRAGFFDYEFAYDPSTQHYELVSHPAGSMLATPMIAGLADSVWDAMTGHWLTRQADLRDSLALHDGLSSSPGFWLKGVGNNLERHAIDFSSIQGAELSFDNSYLQKTRGLIGGLDLINRSTEDYTWIVGVTGGHVKSDVNFKVTNDTAKLTGNAYGVYASFLSGGLFVDGVVSANRLDMTYHVHSLVPAKVRAKTLGAQAEAGYRFQINDGIAYLEPLATLSYVSRDIGDMPLGDYLSASFGKGKTFKGALGMRLGGKAELPAFNIGLAITGRVWDEFKGDHSAVLTGSGQTVALEDTKPGALGDVGATLNLISKDGRLSGFADYGFKFREGYSDSTASVGVRYNF